VYYYYNYSKKYHCSLLSAHMIDRLLQKLRNQIDFPLSL